MTTGAKVAIGCAVAFVVVTLGVAAIVFGGLWWAKGKAEEITANEAQIQELKKKANAVPFTRPADGVVREDRLQAFLDIRKRLYAVYEAHKDEMEAIHRKKDAGLRDMTRTLGVANEIRRTQAQALADVGMSEEEYQFMVEQVYKTLWASEAPRDGKTILDTAGAEDAKARDEFEKSFREGRARQRAETGQAAGPPDVPPANMALFRKHEADIRKYAMTGLEWLGL